MTASELIELLQSIPAEAKIQVHDSQGSDIDVTAWAVELTNQDSRIVLNRDQFYA